MASKSQVCHAWAHQLKPHLKYNDSFSFSDNMLYSYTTAIGQILKLEDDRTVYVINRGRYSSTTDGHIQEMMSAIPDDSVIIPLSLNKDFKYGWDGISSEGILSDNDFLRIIQQWVCNIAVSLREFSDSKSYCLEQMNIPQKYIAEMKKCLEKIGRISLAKLASIPANEWRSSCRYMDGFNEQYPYHKIVKAIEDGAKTPELVDIVCGYGSWSDYRDRSKGARNKSKMTKLNTFLGFSQNKRSYYCRCNFYNPAPNNYKAHLKNKGFLDYYCRPDNNGSIRLNDFELHEKKGDLIQWLLNMRKKNQLDSLTRSEIERKKEIRRSKIKNLECKFGYYERDSYGWYSTPMSFTYNGVTVPIYTKSHPDFSESDYEAFCSMSMEQKMFYIDNRRREYFQYLKQYEANMAEEERRRKERYLKSATRFANRNKYKEVIKELEKTDEGLRELFYKDLIDGHRLYGKNNAFFGGGNVLMRYVPTLDIVETSKNIQLSVNECRRLWILVQRWHNNQSTFISNYEQAQSDGMGHWIIRQYYNDILIAGCHAIAYSEMARLAKELGFIQ